MKRLIGILATFSLTALSVIAADATYYFSGTKNISQVATVTAKAPQLLTITAVATSVPAMTNSLFGATVTRTIQNCGTVPIYYCLGGTASSTNYHGILAGGVAEKDGLGSVVNISAWPGAVSLKTEAGTATVVITELIH